MTRPAAPVAPRSGPTAPAGAPRLADLLDPAALAAAVAERHVRVQRHPDLPLSIYNYTEACVYAGNWTPVTVACRGLIVDDRDGTVVARPYRKFFHHDQPGAPELRLDAPAQITDKVDGSLGVLYPTEDGFAVATRGSFTSAQARHATRVLRTRYPGFVPPPGHTVLVEIVYPGNRIVLDYGGLDDLVLLGTVEITTGRSHGPEAVPDWPGPVVERLPYRTLAEALAAPPRPHREGLVVHWPDTDTRVKVKYPEYLRLHRMVFGLNARAVWERLVTGGDLAELVAPLPDEFHTWVRDVVAELTASVEARAAQIEQAYGEIMAELPAGWTRRDFAARAARHPDRGLLFLRLDGRDYRSRLWRQVRPAADWTPHDQE
ncbi:RNA ligase [Micromonospora sp. HM5-17]|uniref:RNA ligase n=1 Tax=Micromonospora sp. HM5-17 TaxID=2487710 RepID=UPI000F490069|nr:RNA ligase [Micromonospora sp. HM5-17]ROT31584.1 2'-5' RNA ligase [Micromonospora sp. HM5-17]